MTAPAPAPPAAGAAAATVVGVGDVNFATGDGGLATYALGSCLGVAVHDPVAGVAGLLHVMLPSSAGDA